MIFSLFYNFILLLIGLIALPALVWKWLKFGKYRHSLKMRLGMDLPQPSVKKSLTIWIHAVSLGETRAVIPLFRLIRDHYPEASIFVSSTTETGHAEAKRSITPAAGHFFLPLDFSWIIKRIVKKIKPDVLILVESDFWYHLLKYAHEEKAAIFLVNGKVSERSTRRFKKLRFFSEKIFQYFDFLCVQNELYYERFLNIGVSGEKLAITGNLKFDASVKRLTILEKQELRHQLGIKENEFVVVIGSTHEPEEEWLLSALDRVWASFPNLKVIVVPRHPERFDRVMKLLESRHQRVLRYSRRVNQRGDENIIFIDTMGMLLNCYQIATIAIVGGSFIKHVGGHNILEPIQCGIPVLFGPYMNNQEELVGIVNRAEAGKQLTLNELSPLLLFFLTNEKYRQELFKRAHLLSENLQGSSERTFDRLQCALKRQKPF